MKINSRNGLPSNRRSLHFKSAQISSAAINKSNKSCLLYVTEKAIKTHPSSPSQHTHKITKLLLFFAPYKKFFIFIVIYYFTTTTWFIVRKILPCFNSENCVWGVIFDQTNGFYRQIFMNSALNKTCWPFSHKIFVNLLK